MSYSEVTFKIEEVFVYKTFKILNWFLLFFGTSSYIIEPSNKEANNFTFKRKHYTFIIFNKICCLVLTLAGLINYEWRCTSLTKCVIETLDYIYFYMTLILWLLSIVYDVKFKSIFEEILLLNEKIIKFKIENNAFKLVNDKSKIIITLSFLLVIFLVLLDAVISNYFYKVEIFNVVIFYIAFTYLCGAVFLFVFLVNCLKRIFKFLNMLLIEIIEKNNNILSLEELIKLRYKAIQISEEINYIFSFQLLTILNIVYLVLIILTYVFVIYFERIALPSFVMTYVWSMADLSLLIVILYCSDNLMEEVKI